MAKRHLQFELYSTLQFIVVVQNYRFYSVWRDFSCQILPLAAALPFSRSELNSLTFVSYLLLCVFLKLVWIHQQRILAFRKDLSLFAGISGIILFYAYRLASRYRVDRFICAEMDRVYLNFYFDKSLLWERICSILCGQKRHALVFHQKRTSLQIKLQ